LTKDGLLNAKQMTESAFNFLVHPESVVSLYLTALLSAGVADAVMLLAEPGPVYDEKATLRTSTVALPDVPSVERSTTLSMVPAYGKYPQTVVDPDRALPPFTNVAPNGRGPICAATAPHPGVRHPNRCPVTVPEPVALESVTDTQG
jgi:hypothetical protein